MPAHYTGLALKCDQCHRETTIENKTGMPPILLFKEAEEKGWWLGSLSAKPVLCSTCHTKAAGKRGLKSLYVDNILRNSPGGKR